MRWGDALVAFDPNGVVPDTNGKTVKLTIKWKSTAGEKSVDFDYCSRKTIASPTLLNGFAKPVRLLCDKKECPLKKLDNRVKR